MSVQTDSVLSLFSKLCDVHLGERKRCYLVQPKVDRDVHFRHLRHKAFDTLFNYLKSPESKYSGKTACGLPVEVDGVLQTAFRLRLQHCCEEADRLETLFNVVQADGGDEIMAVLRLLVCLAGTGEPEALPPIGYDMYRPPLMTAEKSQTVLPALPERPLWTYYGDRMYPQYPLCAFELPSIDGGWYPHYPRSLFEPPAARCIGEQPEKVVDIFQLLPGTGLGNAFFNPERACRDSHEKTSWLSLFGGLVHPRDVTLDTRLELPDLSDDPQASPPEITIPKALSLSELSEDGGFVSTEVSSSSATTPAESFSSWEEDVWDMALKVKPNRNYTWERIGLEPKRVHMDYLTSAGPQTVDELCRLQRHREHLLEPDSPFPVVRQISPAQLVKDIIYLLNGIPSNTFLFSQEEGCLTIDPRVYTSGMSPTALQSFLTDFIVCGTHYHRLSAFAAPRELDSLYTRGLVLQAFTGAVRSVLQYYRAAVLSIPKDVTLLGIGSHCHRVVRQIRFLAELCHCADKKHSSEDSSFPMGVALITYLYRETLAAVNTDRYLMMLSLLRTTCQPFVLFVQDWVFHGTFRDVYGEFMIQVNPEFLEARDEHYWEKGYTLASADKTRSVSLFLADLASDIFCCGKALNLLRMCSPRHFLCGVSDSEIPRLTISYLRSDLRRINVQCRMYVSRMRQVARQLSMSRAEQQRRAEAARRELLETARRMAAAEIGRLQGVLDASRKRADEKKRVEFQRLKEQMTADLQRRAGDVAEAKEEDKAFMARLTRQEEALTEKEIELEHQARDELIAYYTQLGEEAAKREQKALWRIRRARLETYRRQLLTEDEAKWRAEMEELQQAQDLLEKASDTESLPSWVQGRENSAEPIKVGGASQWEVHPDRQGQEKDWSLPKWVERTDRQTTDAGFCLSTSDASALVADKQKPASGGDGETSTKFAAEAAVISSSGKPAGPAVEEAELAPDVTNMPEWARHVLAQDGENIATMTVAGDEEGDGDVVSTPDQSTQCQSQPMLEGIWLMDGKVMEPLPPIEVLRVSGGGDIGDAADILQKESVISGDKDSVPLQSVGMEVPEAGRPDGVNPSKKLKTGVHMVEGVSASRETLEQPARLQVHVSQSMHATKESTSVEDSRSHVKLVSGMSSTKETESDETYVPHTKQSQTMYASKQTEEAVQKPHLKVVAGQHANIQSQQEIKVIPKMATSSKYNISTETQPTEWKIKKPSLFGHVSQLSKMDYTFHAPKLRRQKDMHANLESDFREFTVKPNIRMHQTRSATAESTEQVDRPQIYVSKEFHVSKESEYQDWEGIRRKRFQEHNIHGHSSDSTVQKLLYGEKFGVAPGTIKEEEEGEIKQTIPPFTMDTLDLMQDDREPLRDNLDRLNLPLTMDLLSGIPGVVQGGLGGYGGEDDLTEVDAEAVAFTPLSVLLNQALAAPLAAQISLVNEMVVSFFLGELKMDEHFEALHRYLFMADGDFAENLTDILLEKLSACHLPYEMLTPWFLNAALSRALQLSSSTAPCHADNLSFALRYMPEFFRHDGHDALDCLELRYKVSWPMNVVLTESCMTSYGRVFTFMLQLKRVAWMLKDCWHKLKRDAIVKKAKDSSQFRQLQLHRQEMQHFVRVMQGYMANQIIQVTWKELQESLDRDVHSLDDLRRVHGEYLNKALFRCLLNKKAAPIMKIIQDISCLILKFCSQLGSATWGHDLRSGDITHPNFAAMVSSYKAFKEYFVFLFKVVNKLAVRGYQPHLQELLLRLNFNDYYST